MGTILGVLVETQSRADFWRVLGVRGVRCTASSVPPTVLIYCDGLLADFTAPLRLAEDWSRDLSTKTIALVAQTAASVMTVHAFDGGVAIRRIEYQDDAGWIRVEGQVQPWEPALFFDDTRRSDSEARDGPWPSVLEDEISDADFARYWEAIDAGEPSRVLDLIYPDHLCPIYRLCAFYGLDAAAPSAYWKKPSIFARLLGR